MCRLGLSVHAGLVMVAIEKASYSDSVKKQQREAILLLSCKSDSSFWFCALDEVACAYVVRERFKLSCWWGFGCMVCAIYTYSVSLSALQMTSKQSAESKAEAKVAERSKLCWTDYRSFAAYSWTPMHANF